MTTRPPRGSLIWVCLPTSSQPSCRFTMRRLVQDCLGEKPPCLLRGERLQQILVVAPRTHLIITSNTLSLVPKTARLPCVSCFLLLQIECGETYVDRCLKSLLTGTERNLVLNAHAVSHDGHNIRANGREAPHLYKHKSGTCRCSSV